MLEMIVGMALGAMAFTETGREIGNKIANTTVNAVKGAVKNVASDESAKQPTGAAGDAGDNR